MFYLQHGLAIGAQPQPVHIRSLANRGISSVVNLCKEAEPGPALDAEKEGILVAASGMAYVHLPIAEITREGVIRFRRELARLIEPVFVHCSSGRRAGLLALAHLAIRSGRPFEQELEHAARLGFILAPPASTRMEDLINACREEEMLRNAEDTERSEIMGGAEMRRRLLGRSPRIPLAALPPS